MAASQTVPEVPLGSKSPTLIVPRYGVVTLFGFGIRVYVERGHLTIEDGIGMDRRNARIPRVGHGLRRLVLIGSDGFLSLPALRWLSDQKISFVMLERDGTVLATTGPVYPTDARLRRSQSLASLNGKALEISKGLIERKLTAQEHLVRDSLKNPDLADVIAQNRAAAANASTIDRVRLFESKGASAYWSAWRNVRVTFPNQHLSRVPTHWQTFGTRVSALTGSPRLATNPANAILNYLYAVLEAEARLAAAALGLDPGIGVMHVDSLSRDSLACDLMEPVRPVVDRYVWDWVTSGVLRREWFFEQGSGNCRLMNAITVRLAETGPTWGRAVGPLAEWVARELSVGIKRQVLSGLPPTRLTQTQRREARPIPTHAPVNTAPRPTRLCKGCGAEIQPAKSYCAACGEVVSKERMPEVARIGRVAAQSDDAQAKRAMTRITNALAQRAWESSKNPEWLNEEYYRRNIQPKLSAVEPHTIMRAVGVSHSYANDIRLGRRTPHPRHWLTLARLVGVSLPE